MGLEQHEWEAWNLNFVRVFYLSEGSFTSLRSFYLFPSAFKNEDFKFDTSGTSLVEGDPAKGKQSRAGSLFGGDAVRISGWVCIFISYGVDGHCPCGADVTSVSPPAWESGNH